MLAGGEAFWLLMPIWWIQQVIWEILYSAYLSHCILGQNSGHTFAKSWVSNDLSCMEQHHCPFDTCITEAQMIELFSYVPPTEPGKFYVII
jgi:hypothetical protein